MYGSEAERLYRNVGISWTIHMCRPMVQELRGIGIFTERDVFVPRVEATLFGLQSPLVIRFLQHIPLLSREPTRRRQLCRPSHHHRLTLAESIIAELHAR